MGYKTLRKKSEKQTMTVYDGNKESELEQTPVNIEWAKAHGISKHFKQPIRRTS